MRWRVASDQRDRVMPPALPVEAPCQSCGGRRLAVAIVCCLSGSDRTAKDGFGLNQTIRFNQRSSSADAGEYRSPRVLGQCARRFKSAERCRRVTSLQCKPAKLQRAHGPLAIPFPALEHAQAAGEHAHRRRVPTFARQCCRTRRGTQRAAEHASTDCRERRRRQLLDDVTGTRFVHEKSTRRGQICAVQSRKKDSRPTVAVTGCSQ
jgi:hypothetical protein